MAGSGRALGGQWAGTVKCALVRTTRVRGRQSAPAHDVCRVGAASTEQVSRGTTGDMQARQAARTARRRSASHDVHNKSIECLSHAQRSVGGCCVVRFVRSVIRGKISPRSVTDRGEILLEFGQASSTGARPPKSVTRATCRRRGAPSPPLAFPCIARDGVGNRVGP